MASATPIRRWRFFRSTMRTETALFMVVVALWGGIWAGVFGGQLCGPPPHNQSAEDGDSGKNIAQAEKDVAGATRTGAILIKLPSEKAGEQEKAADKNGYCSAYFSGIDLLNVKITDLLIAVFTYLLFTKTAGLYSATRGLQRASIKQSVDMKDSIIQAARAGTAMERIATSIAENTTITRDVIERQKSYAAMQLRAYISVIVGGGVTLYQNRCNNIAFQGGAQMVNNGATPAHNVTFWASVDVLPVPLPEHFAFPPRRRRKQHSATLGSRHFFNISAVMDYDSEDDLSAPVGQRRFVDDSEIAEIKLGVTKALYMWGVVTYDDEFKMPHFTNFCLHFAWFGSGEKEGVNGYYHARHNDSD
jgi:hypothetical protein